MKEQAALLDEVTSIISETLGVQTGELFHKFYEFDDDEGILQGARSVLTGFVGPKLTAKKLSPLGHRS